jgi:hypothetical protein
MNFIDCPPCDGCLEDCDFCEKLQEAQKKLLEET